MKIHPKKLIFGGIALLLAGLAWELANGVRHYKDVTIVGKVIAGIGSAGIILFVLYVMFVMVKQMITGKNK